MCKVWRTLLTTTMRPCWGRNFLLVSMLVVPPVVNVSVYAAVSMVVIILLFDRVRVSTLKLMGSDRLTCVAARLLNRWLNPATWPENLRRLVRRL